jgi:hypothetical protein
VQPYVQEFDRRPVAAVRAGYRQLDMTNNVRAPAQLDLVDSEYYAMEATRRPRAMARLQKQSTLISSYDDLANAAADAAAAAVVGHDLAAAAAAAAAAAQVGLYKLNPVETHSLKRLVSTLEPMK